MEEIALKVAKRFVEERKRFFERAELIAKLREGIEAEYIFQIHLVTPEEFEVYKKFIDVMKEV